jgi:hypothetical protein
MVITENRLVAEALKENRSLESLTLTTPLHEVQASTTGKVLNRLTNHASLRYLGLYPLDNDRVLCRELCSFLALAPALEHLTFHDVTFDKNWTEHLMIGLAARKMIHTLEFSLCYFHEEATVALEALASAYYDGDGEPKIQIHKEINIGDSIAWMTAIA